MLLLIFATAGFFFAFYSAVGDEDVEGFESVPLSILTLYRTSLSGEMEFEEFRKVASDNRAVVLTLLGVVYVGISAIVLINLLIAMLSEVFTNVQSKAKEQVCVDPIFDPHCVLQLFICNMEVFHSYLCPILLTLLF